MRIILLGSEEGGKTSAGNTILGRKAFELKKSAECIKKDGVVAGRQITVVDTPGRRKDYLASSTRILYKDEVVRSVAIASPGPHALLLVIKINCPFEPVCKQAVEEHLQLFGENVWNHIIVLFTHGDKLEDITIQQYIQDEGDPLQKLLQKCGNRYHVFNNMERKDHSQVNELLKKIEDIVVRNKGHHFQMDKHVLQVLIVKKKELDEKAKERRMLMPRPKRILQSTDLRMVLLGHQCSGKSSAGDTILGKNLFDFKTVPTSVLKKSTVAGRQLTVIDTPGWLKDGLLKDTSKKSKYEIVRSVSLCAPGPHAFLLVIPVDSTFTNSDEKSIIEHLEIFGDQVWSYVILVFSHADWMGDTAIELYIESEGEAIQRLVEKCGNKYHALNNMTTGDRPQVIDLLEKIEHNVIVNKGNHFEMDANIIDKMELCSLQEEVESDGMNQRSGKGLTSGDGDTSGYGTSLHTGPLSLRSDESMEKFTQF
ncbi:GTPase IMAP family member 8-like [Alosa sapidissima]|uniref:GTPase IMAP family member 8-like n=1 Tax=Alosa sapidissima TaxID=34773 RepID=UPI001C083BD8|nr:GTPase IMAP family member 8-like [Alosa sapidissima]